MLIPNLVHYADTPPSVFPRRDRGNRYPVSEVLWHDRKPLNTRRILDRPVKPVEDDFGAGGLGRRILGAKP